MFMVTCACLASTVMPRETVGLWMGSSAMSFVSVEVTESEKTRHATNLEN